MRSIKRLTLSLASAFTSYVNIYKAMGGGWVAASEKRPQDTGGSTGQGNDTQ